MAEKMYEVIDEQYYGAHRKYSKGQLVPESEISGNLEILLNGDKGKKFKDKDGNEKVMIKGKPAKLKLYTKKGKQMIAVRPLKVKLDKRSFTVLEGREIPEYILKNIDIEALKKSGSIRDNSKPKYKKVEDKK